MGARLIANAFEMMIQLVKQQPMTEDELILLMHVKVGLTEPKLSKMLRQLMNLGIIEKGKDGKLSVNEEKRKQIYG